MLSCSIRRQVSLSSRAASLSLWSSLFASLTSADCDSKWGHTMLVNPMGEVVATTEEKEDIVFADVEPKVLEDARKGIPVTIQRRFDVYKDVSQL